MKDYIEKVRSQITKALGEFSELSIDASDYSNIRVVGISKTGFGKTYKELTCTETPEQFAAAISNVLSHEADGASLNLKTKSVCCIRNGHAHWIITITPVDDGYHMHICVDSNVELNDFIRLETERLNAFAVEYAQQHRLDPTSNPVSRPLVGSRSWIRQLDKFVVKKGEVFCLNLSQF
ncbi:hypothetical protein [Vibrio vulnificus]|uniref:hypothetical protein n=1 Tax=Vibrio vulnificus TaxID=672 RepID=UPI0028C09485|nr:hypothetical protein [Vibrio vulnificus]HDY7951853.1 hypothetical protein [Vibrio vulnificus]